VRAIRHPKRSSARGERAKIPLIKKWPTCGHYARGGHEAEDVTFNTHKIQSQKILNDIDDD